MSDLDTPTASTAGTGGAGRMLREAREAQGLSIDVLATTMKVSVRKLEMLETERFDELPDATFARALAQSVCRSLKIDAAPVLALLPRASGHRIEMVSEGLNAPFRDHPSRLDPLAWAASLKSMWAPALVLALAALVFFLPGSILQSVTSTVSGLFDSIRSNGATGTEQTATQDLALPPSVGMVNSGNPAAPVSETVSVPGQVAATAAAAQPAPAAAVTVAPSTPAPSPGILELSASAESWIEVKDGRDRVLLSRSLRPDETVMLDGAMPMRVKIGNAAVTKLRYRGELIDLGPMTNENIARVLLK